MEKCKVKILIKRAFKEDTPYELSVEDCVSLRKIHEEAKEEIAKRWPDSTGFSIVGIEFPRE